MKHKEALIKALLQDGIEPTDQAVASLDAQITELAEILVDYWILKTSKIKPERDGNRFRSEDVDLPG